MKPDELERPGEPEDTVVGGHLAGSDRPTDVPPDFDLPDLASGLAAEALAPARWVWAAMDPPERRARMRELAEWVEWLISSHGLHNTVPACWYRHPPVIEHLTALYAGWIRTYCVDERDSAGRDLGEAEWLATLHNFTPYLNVPACLSGGHQELPARRPASAEASDELAVFLWTSDFGTRPAVHPAPDAAARLYADDDELL